MSSSFTEVFGGNTIYPSDVSYREITLSADVELEWPLEATATNNVVARILDISTEGIYSITMPSADEVSVGQTILFNNLGPDVVTVLNQVGNAILSLSAGEQWQIYLVDNSTPQGTWRTFQYGAATAQAQASALAGPGLMSLGSTLAQSTEVVEHSVSPVAVTVPDRARTFVWTGGLGTLELPTAVSATDGWFLNVRNAGQGDLTIDPAGSEDINGDTTLVLQPGDSASVVTDGVEWYTIGLGQQSVFAFDYTSIPVTTGTYTLSGSELNRIAYKFTGTLSGNVTVEVPATIQQYWINNATTGAYTLSVKAVGSASSVTVDQSTSGIFYCDGVDMIAATTSSAFGGTLPIANGGTGAVTAGAALTNLGATGIGSSVFTAANEAAARTAILAAASGANSDITSLSGITTPLSVAQGGTGADNAGDALTNLGAAASGVNTDITELNSASGVKFGAPTTGSWPGTAGTINATGIYINGVSVGTSGGTVSSVDVSGGTTGLSASGGPITSTGTITLSGTLAVANGGTGQTSYTNGQLLIGNTTGNTLTKATLTAGSGISITNGAGSITIAATGSGGTVTSVAASGGTTGLSFTGSPITGSGTLTLGGTLAVASGGTGAATAAGARLNIGAAASGANSDITSLSGLTTPLSVAQGGTGGATASAARTSLGAAASGANSDITSLTGLTTPLSVTRGGTGATTASGARTSLGAAASGANSDISSMSGLGDGTEVAPSLTFSSDSNTGLFLSGPDSLGLTAGGTGRLFVNTTNIQTVLPVQTQDGSATAPVYSFSIDTNTGLYRVGNDSLGMTTGGTLRVTLNTTSLTSTLPFYAPNGAAATPAYTFSGDTDTGIYYTADPYINIAIAGTRVGLFYNGGFSSAGGVDGTYFYASGDYLRIGTSATPASAAASGNTGQIKWDSNYIYVCVAPNTWKRVAIATW